MSKATCTWDNTTASRQRTRTKRYNEDSCQTGRHTLNTGIFKSNLAICLKRQVYNSCVLPAMTYGAETWTLTKQAQNRPTSVSGRGQKRTMKWSWAGHINRLKRQPMDLACHHLETIMSRKDDKGDQPSGGETTWTNTGATRYGRGHHKTLDRVIWRRHAEAFAHPRNTSAT